MIYKQIIKPFSFQTLIVSIGVILMVFVQLPWVNDPKLHITGIILAIINLLLIIKLLFTKELTISHTNRKLVILIVILSIFYAFSILGSALKIEAIFMFFKIANYTLFFILLTLYSTKKLIDWKYIEGAITVAFILTLLVVSFELFYSQTSPYYVSGTFMNKNITAIFLLISIPFVVQTIYASNSKLLKISLVFAVLYYISITVLLHNKAVLLGGFLGVTIVSFISFSQIKKTKPYIFIISSIGLLVILTLIILIVPGLSNSILDSTTFSERLIFWENSLKMLREHPHGVGGGNWQFWFPKYGIDGFYVLNEAIENGMQTVQRPHNDYLWIATEAGILALLIHLIFIFTLLKTLVSKTSSKMGLHTKSIQVVFIAYLVISFFDFPLERNDIQFFYIVFISYALTRFDTTSQITLVKFPKLIPATVALIIAIGSLVIQTERLHKEYKATTIIRNDFTGNWTETIKLFENTNFKWYPINNFSIPHEWYVASAHLKHGNFESAEYYLIEAHKKAPFQLCIINNLSGLYLGLNRNEETLLMTEKGSEISSKNKKNLLHRSIALFNLKKIEEAFDCYIQIVNRHDNPEPYHQIMTIIFNKYIEFEKAKESPNYSIESLNNIQNSDSLKKVFLYEVQMNGKSKHYMLNVFDFEIK